MALKAITIKDIAKALNIAPSSVSKALRKSHDISIQTQKLVLNYAEKHNYKPNPIAQGLRKGRSKSIGVVVSNIDNNFFSQAINGIESVAHKNDYSVIITQSRESYELEVKDVLALSSRAVDGLIVSISSETNTVDHFKELHDKGLAIVFFDRVTDKIKTHQVVSDNIKGAYEATMHLISQGFRSIAQITSADSLSITKERLEGHRKAIQESGLTFDENYIKYCEHGGMIPEETEQAIDELLQLRQKPDAIVTASDRLTTTTLSVLRKKNIKVPEEIALVGFTNSVSADIFNPSLSSVVQPAFEIGRQATELLIQSIESKRPVTRFEKRVLTTELIIRDSSIKKGIEIS